jgi:hypothetical protein
MNKVIEAGFISAAFMLTGDVMAQMRDAGIYGIDKTPEIRTGADRGGVTVRVDDLLAPHAFSRALRDPLWPESQRWPDTSGRTRDEVSLAYGWRNVSVEGALSTENDRSDNWLRLGSDKPAFASSHRLSFTSHKNWTFQISRGRMNRPDQVDPNEEIKRTTIATIYQYPFDHAKWQTTIAYGRSGKKADGSTGDAYLFESLLQIRRSHVVFARAERALADELFLEREALPGQNFNTNRYTLGYVYNVPSTGLTKLTVGGLVSKRVVPFDHVGSFGTEPVGYKVFVRLSIQMH